MMLEACLVARDWRPIFLESSEGNGPTGDVGGMARTIRSFWFLDLPAPSSCVAVQRIAQKPPIDIMLLCYVLLNSFNAAGTHLVCSTDIRSNGGNRRSTSSITARATEAAMKRSPSIVLLRTVLSSIISSKAAGDLHFACGVMSSLDTYY